MDSCAWLLGIYTTVWSVNALNSHDEIIKWTVVASVSVANWTGSWADTTLGKKYVHAAEPAQLRIEHLAAEVENLKLRLARLEPERLEPEDLKLGLRALIFILHLGLDTIVSRRVLVLVLAI
jgi:hypothetical protein